MAYRLGGGRSIRLSYRGRPSRCHGGRRCRRTHVDPAGRAASARTTTSAQHPLACSWGDLRLRRLRARRRQVRAATRRRGLQGGTAGVRRARPPGPRTRTGRHEGGDPRHGVGRPLRERVSPDEPYQGVAPGGRRHGQDARVVRTVHGAATSSSRMRDERPGGEADPSRAPRSSSARSQFCTTAMACVSPTPRWATDRRW